jgi:tetratricopeptide (TPR) repeat protein
VVATFVAYIPALQAGWTEWDDPNFITDCPPVQGFSAANLRWMLTAFHGGHFHPLTNLSWALDYTLWGGLNAHGFHFTNVLLHAACAVLFFLVLRRLLSIGFASPATRALTLSAALGAALFALHPLRVESVAWITERRDVLSGAFLLGAVLAYLHAVRPGEPGVASRSAYWWSVALLVLSCLSKAWGMSLFAVLLVLDWYPLQRLPRSPLRWLGSEARRLYLEKAPHILVGVLTAAAAAHAQHVANATKSLAAWGLPERLVQSAYGLLFYVRTTVLPTGLSALYQLPVRIDPLEPRFLAAYAFLGVSAVLIALCWRRLPAVVSAAGVYLICIAPVLGILQSGEQFVADRYAYLSCAVFPALVAAAVLAVVRWAGRAADDEAARSRRPLALLAWAAGVVACLAMGVLTSAQAAVWHDSETLWKSAVINRPESQPLGHYAGVLDRQGRKAEAIEALRSAVSLNPTDGRAWFALGNRMREVGTEAVAEHDRLKAAGDNPGAAAALRAAAAAFTESELSFQNAARTLPQAYMAYVNLGSLYLENLGRTGPAIEAFRAAVADVEKGGRRPLSAGPYVALGAALRATGDYAGARAALTHALNVPETHDKAEAELKLLDEAERGAAAPARP